MYRNTAVSAKSHKKSSKTASPQPYAPFSTILASFSTAATVACYRIPRELQGLYGERRRRERERERATVELKLARNLPEPSVPIRKKNSGTQGRVYLWFSIPFFLRHANSLSLCCVII